MEIWAVLNSQLIPLCRPPTKNVPVSLRCRCILCVAVAFCFRLGAPNRLVVEKFLLPTVFASHVTEHVLFMVITEPQHVSEQGNP